MSFRNSVQTSNAQSAAAAPQGNRQPGGRYAAIRAAQPKNSKLKKGEYILEFERTYKSRTESTFMFDAKVVELLHGNAESTQAGEHALGLINIGGRSYDAGMPVVKSIVMALCAAESDEQLDQEEPEWDLLLDALCEEERGTSSKFGPNPAKGHKVWCRCWYSTATDKNGAPYQNFEFRPHFEDKA